MLLVLISPKTKTSQDKEETLSKEQG